MKKKDVLFEQFKDTAISAKSTKQVFGGKTLVSAHVTTCGGEHERWNDYDDGSWEKAQDIN